jgi:hypothetical protein
MREITGDAINRAIAQVNEFSEQQFAALFKRIENEQPAIMGYLAEADDELGEDEREFLTYLSVVGWDIITTALGNKSKVIDAALDSQLERNIGLFENYSEDKMTPDPTCAPCSRLLNGQGALMDFLMSMLVDRPDSFEGEIRDEMIPAMMIHMKTVIDCLVSQKTKKRAAAAGRGEKMIRKAAVHDIEGWVSLAREVEPLFGPRSKTTDFAMRLRAPSTRGSPGA